MTNTEARLGTACILISPSVQRELPCDDVYAALARHARGDFSRPSHEDRKAIDLARRGRHIVISVHRGSNGTKFWVATEPVAHDGYDGSVTSVLLPHENLN